MVIKFSDKWAPDPDTFGIVFEATADGLPIRCRVLTEALQDIDSPNALGTPESQFTSNQSRFQEIAKLLILAGRVKNGQVVIGSTDVRT